MRLKAVPSPCVCLFWPVALDSDEPKQAMVHQLQAWIDATRFAGAVRGKTTVNAA